MSLDEELKDIASHTELLKRYVLLEQVNAKLKVKADLWDAMLSSDRIRILGHAEIDGPHPHFGMEIWGHYPDCKSSEYGIDIITRYANTILKNQHSHNLIKGQRVKFTNIDICNADDWGLSQEEFDELMSHENKIATVSCINVRGDDHKDFSYVSVEFDDGYQIRATSGYHLEVMDE